MPVQTPGSTELETTVRMIIAEHLGMSDHEVIRTASFIDDLGVDDVDTEEIVLAIEEAFAVTLPAAVVVTLATVGDLVDHVARQVSAQ